MVDLDSLEKFLACGHADTFMTGFAEALLAVKELRLARRACESLNIFMLDIGNAESAETLKDAYQAWHKAVEDECGNTH